MGHQILDYFWKYIPPVLFLLFSSGIDLLNVNVAFPTQRVQDLFPKKKKLMTLKPC